MPLSDIIRVREMLTIGTRFKLESADRELPPETFDEREVTEVHLHGIMAQYVVDGQRTDAKAFTPVGCTVGATDAEILPDNAFAVFRPGQAGSRMVYRLMPTTFWVLILPATGTAWEKVAEGSDFGQLARDLYDRLHGPNAPAGPAPRDAVIFQADYIQSHPELYPVAAPAASR